MLSSGEDKVHHNPLHVPSKRGIFEVETGTCAREGVGGGNGYGDNDLPPPPQSRSRSGTKSNMRRLQSVIGENALGGKFGYSIRVRIAMEKTFECVGGLIGKHRAIQAFLIVATLVTCCVFASFLDKAKVETSIPKLWVESGGRLEVEADYISNHRGKNRNKGKSMDERYMQCQDGEAGGGIASTAPPSSSRRMRRLESGDISYSSQTSMGSFTIELMIFTPKVKGEDVVSRDVLNDYLNFVTYLHEKKLTVKDGDREVTASLNDICAKIQPPKELSLFASLIPCTRMTVLDCFSEGRYDFDKIEGLLPTLHKMSTIKDDYGVVGYDGLPKFKDATTDLHQVITEGCQGYARKVKAMKWRETNILGSPKKDTNGNIQKVSAYQHIFGLAKGKAAAAALGTTPEVAKKFLDAWKEMLLETVDDKENKYKHITATVLTNDMLGKALKGASQANSFATASGILIMLGFVVLVLSTWSCKPQARFKCELASVGVAGLLLVMLASLGACGLAAMLAISFNATSLQVIPFLALGLGVDDMFILLHSFDEIERYGMSAKRNKEAIRRRSNLWRKKSVEKVIGEMLSRAGPSVSMTSFSNFAAFMIGGLIPLPAVQTFCLQAAFVVAFNYLAVIICLTPILAIYESKQGHKDEMISDDSPDSAKRVIAEFVEHKYMPFLLKPAVKACVVAFFVIFTGVCVYGISIVKDGLDVADIAPRDSHLSKFLDARFTYFSNYDVMAITGKTDYPCRQKDILNFQKELATSRWVDSVGPSWLDAFLDFVKSNRSSVNATASGFCPPNQFYAALKEWDNDLGSALDALTVQLSALGFTKEGQLVFAPTLFTVVDLVDTEAYKAMIADTRAICEKQPFPAFPEGIPYTYWEQYNNLRRYFWVNIGLVLGALVLLVLPFLVNSIAALIIAVTILMIVVQIFGLMGFAAIKFSAIPAVALIMSVGMSDQFLDHLTMAFLLEVGGTKNQRITRAMTKMFSPVFEGGLSTVLAIMLLAFSRFEFVVKYFFLPFFFVVVTGVINGLVFLPVVLSLIGPSALGCCTIDKE